MVAGSFVAAAGLVAVVVVAVGLVAAVVVAAFAADTAFDCYWAYVVAYRGAVASGSCTSAACPLSGSFVPFGCSLPPAYCSFD